MSFFLYSLHFIQFLLTIRLALPNILYILALEDISPPFASARECALALGEWGDALARGGARLTHFTLKPAHRAGGAALRALTKSCGEALESVEMRRAPIGARSLIVLARRCPLLRRLTVGFTAASTSRTAVGDGAIAALVDGCPHLERLHIGNIAPHATARGLARLDELAALRDVRLQRRRARGAQRPRTSPGTSPGGAPGGATTRPRPALFPNGRCERCDAHVPNVWDHADHAEEACPHRDSLCPAGCGAWLKRSDPIEGHFAHCPNFTVLCPARRCTAVVQRSALAGHMRTCHSEASALASRRRCRLCPLWASGCCIVLGERTSRSGLLQGNRSHTGGDGCSGMRENGAAAGAKEGRARGATHAPERCDAWNVVCLSCGVDVQRRALDDGTHALACIGPRRVLAMVERRGNAVR